MEKLIETMAAFLALGGLLFSVFVEENILSAIAMGLNSLVLGGILILARRVV